MSLYIKLIKDQIIEKFVDLFDDLWMDSDVFSEVADAKILLVEDEEHVKLLER